MIKELTRTACTMIKGKVSIPIEKLKELEELLVKTITDNILIIGDLFPADLI